MNRFISSKKRQLIITNQEKTLEKTEEQ